jgi:alginate O-acetyltransferase complex protein AlgI
MLGYTLGLLLLVALVWVMAWHVRSVKARQALLLLASYAFYASWGLGFLCILVASSLLNFGLGVLLRRNPSARYLWLGIAVNVLLLGFFKFLPPILEAGGTAAWYYPFAHWILMPVGMSFWTFQALSHLWDTYLEQDVEPTLLEFSLYMAFWPTVFSGPVCRLPHMLPQFRQEPVFSSSNVSAGALRLVQGLFMKICLAQILASGWIRGEGVDAGFDGVAGGWGAVDVWLLGMGFGLLLFFDFAGYSHMVIGTARVFGIRLPENFNRPFLSTTPSEFWTRWHMSLSFWIRDYVFKPLAALRRDAWWPYVVLVISMTIFGLWHGARWTFVVFGVYHGFVLVLHRLGQQAKRLAPVRPPRFIGVPLSWCITFLFVSLGFVIFRAGDLTSASMMLRSVLSPAAYRHFALPRSFYILMLVVAVGYFVISSAHAFLSAWVVRYRGQESPRMERTAPFRLASTATFTFIMGAAADFIATRLWWWFAPVLTILIGLGGLAVYQQRAVVTVTPFIYTLF